MVSVRGQVRRYSIYQNELHLLCVGPLGLKSQPKYLKRTPFCESSVADGCHYYSLLLQNHNLETLSSALCRMHYVVVERVILHCYDLKYFQKGGEESAGAHNSLGEGGVLYEIFMKNSELEKNNEHTFAQYTSQGFFLRVVEGKGLRPLHTRCNETSECVVRHTAP